MERSKGIIDAQLDMLLSVERGAHPLLTHGQIHQIVRYLGVTVMDDDEHGIVVMSYKDRVLGANVKMDANARASLVFMRRLVALLREERLLE